MFFECFSLLRYTGDFPDCISFNGSRVQLLNASGDVILNTQAKTGKIHVWFDAKNLQPEEGNTKCYVN